MKGRPMMLGAATALTVAVACSGGGKSGEAAVPTLALGASSSFARIQTQLFEKSCAFTSCHAPGSSATSLVLTGSGVHARLVGVLPVNGTARNDGLKLVVAGKPDSSLLWHKLNQWLAGHHAHDYGGAMPQNAPSLSVEQLNFVRQWIENGASPTADDVDPALLAGTTRPENAPYTPLAPPSTGFQIKLSSFAVRSSFERELFDYKLVGNTSDVFVNRIQTQMRAGSHHFVLYTFAANTPSVIRPAIGAVRDIRNLDGTYNVLNVAPMEYHVFFAGTQATSSDFRFPAGVALRIPAGLAIDMNSHYVNASAQDVTGEAEANLWTVPASQVTQEASTLNLANTDLTIPKGRDTTIIKTFRFSTLTRIVALTSHMHARGQKFVIRIAGGPRNGEIVFTNTSWDHPPFIGFDTPIVLQPGEGLTSEVTYHGDPSKVVKFGLTSEDEMDIIFGYWY
jgi:hypothetical protein